MSENKEEKNKNDDKDLELKKEEDELDSELEKIKNDIKNDLSEEELKRLEGILDLIKKEELKLNKKRKTSTYVLLMIKHFLLVFIGYMAAFFILKPYINATYKAMTFTILAVSFAQVLLKVIFTNKVSSYAMMALYILWYGSLIIAAKAISNLNGFIVFSSLMTIIVFLFVGASVSQFLSYILFRIKLKRLVG